jgi:hypothetical protein
MANRLEEIAQEINRLKAQQKEIERREKEEYEKKKNEEWKSHLGKYYIIQFGKRKEYCEVYVYHAKSSSQCDGHYYTGEMVMIGEHQEEDETTKTVQNLFSIKFNSNVVVNYFDNECSKETFDKVKSFATAMLEKKKSFDDFIEFSKTL